MEINYETLNVLEYGDINKSNTAEEIIKRYNSRKKLITPVYNIRQEGLTNLTKYLFYPELELFTDENLISGFRLLQEFDNDEYENPNVFIGDANRTDYNHLEIANNPEKSFTYHVLIDVNATNFEKAMTKIRKSAFYKGEYIYQSIATDKIVVLIYSVCKEFVLRCSKGDINNLFLEGNRIVLSAREGIVVTYFKVDQINKRLVFTEESAALFSVIKPELKLGEADALIESLKIDCPKTIAILYERHGSNYEILK